MSLPSDSLSVEQKRALVRQILAAREKEKSLARHEPFPLNEMQQAYLVGRMPGIAYGGVGCHAYIELDCEVHEPARLERAWDAVVAEHDMLRAVLLDGGMQQVRPSLAPAHFPLIDLSAETEDAAARALAALREEMDGLVLDLEQGPPFEIRLVRLAGGRLRVLLHLDLMFVDASGIYRLVGAWAAQLRSPGEPARPLAVTFRDCVLAEEKKREEPAWKAALAAWRARIPQLAGPPQLPVRARPPLGQAQFRSFKAQLDPAAWERLRGHAAALEVTSTALLAGLFAEVVRAWSATPRFCLNLTTFTRPSLHADVARVLGEFTSTLLLDMGDDEGTVDDRVRALQSRLAEDLDLAQVSGVRVVREINRERAMDQALIYPIVFTSLLGQTRGYSCGADFRGGFAPPVHHASATPQVWLDHQLIEDEGALHSGWDVMEGVFEPGVIEGMHEAWRWLLERASAPVVDWGALLPLPLPATDQQERDAANQTAGPLPQGLLHGPAVAAALRSPLAPAVWDGERCLTHGELLRRSQALALRLRALDLPPASPVAVYLPAGWEQSVAVLGILQASLAYLPLDPALPVSRVAWILAHAGVKVAVSAAAVEAPAGWPAEVLRLDVDAIDPLPAPVEIPSRVGPADLAYVIFTSGSTGQPKGVMISHEAACNTIDDVNTHHAVGSQDRTFAISALSFDLSVWDIFGVLGAGGALVVPDRARRQDPAAWVERANRHGVTIWNSVPALVEMLVDDAATRPEGLPPSLRLVMMSGDWIPVSLPDRLRALRPDLEVISMGGATEAAIWSIRYPITTVDPAWRSIPYGRPMRNQRFYVLNATLAQAPTRVVGDLYIGGVGLALGYLGDAARTDAAFREVPGLGRLYRTGDKGRYLPGGDIEFLGRDDAQVKVGGHRIELGEIESHLLRHPGVAAAVAQVVGPAMGTRRLMACVVPRPAPVGVRAAGDLPPAWQALVQVPAGEASAAVDADTAAALVDHLGGVALQEVFDTLEHLGAFRAGELAADTAPVDYLLARTGILPRYRAWLGRSLDALTAAGLLVRQGGGWAPTSRRLTIPPPPAATGVESVMRARSFLSRGAKGLAAALTGGGQAVEMLFVGGEAGQEVVSKLHRRHTVTST